MHRDRRLRAVRLAEAMKACGVARDEGITFGRPRVKGHGTPVQELWNRFVGGDSIAFIAKDFHLTRTQVENAIRFVNRFPQCDSTSFWTDPRTRDYAKYLDSEGGDGAAG